MVVLLGLPLWATGRIANEAACSGIPRLQAARSCGDIGSACVKAASAVLTC